MKKLLKNKYAILLGLLVGYNQALFAQEGPPLYLSVSDQGFTVVVLEAKINEVNLGSDDYVAKINHN